MGAIIRKDLDLSDSLMSFVKFSIEEILIHSDGLILICTIEGPMSNPSTDTGIPNSINLFCRDFAFSTIKFWSIEVVCPSVVSKREYGKVGLSPEKWILGRGFVSVGHCEEANFLSNVFLIIS
jgi:hypothetical protein